jgi:hypothetical protein
MEVGKLEAQLQQMQTENAELRCAALAAPAVPAIIAGTAGVGSTLGLGTNNNAFFATMYRITHTMGSDPVHWALEAGML